MSCAPFKSPVDNALSYLHTKKVIDSSRRVIAPDLLQAYLNILQRQANQHGVTDPLFTVSNGYLEPTTAFDELEDDEGRPVFNNPRVEDRLRVRNNNRGNSLVPGVFNTEELLLAQQLVELGDVSLKC